jgi:hypothetical protein
MLEESLFKTNFIGRDGFRWWIGQVAPQSCWQDQADGAGWGNRVKVRIMGYHPYSELELPNEDLPWAQVLLGVTDGSGACNRAKTPKIEQADTVLGFFLDGDNAQLPCILGVFGRTDAVSYSGPYSAPFEPFTGFSGPIKKSSAVVANESNESNLDSQKSPRMVSPEIAEKLNKDIKDPNKKEKAGFNAIGKKVTMATAKISSEIDNIKTDIENFVGDVQNIIKGITDGIGDFKQQINERIGAITKSIQSGATGLIHNMTGALSEAMGGAMNKGLDVLYKTVYATVLAATGSSKAADVAGIAAQSTFISPVKAISDALPCIANSVIGGIGGMIQGLLTNIADNVSNFVQCVADQGVGAIMNTIIGGVTKALQPLLGGVGKILGGFNPFSFLTSAVDAFQNVVSALDCNEPPADYALASNEWTIGVGTNEGSGTPVSQILETANKAREAASRGFGIVDAVQDIAGLTGSLGVFDFANPSVSTPGFESVLGNCYAGPPELGGCGGTKIKIFGGKGIGGVANAIIGLANADRGVTGSLLGVDLVNGGGGYTTPPFVEIVDECKSGYGAVARAVIDYDPNSPTYQEIIDIILVSPGENYTPSVDNPVNDITIDTDRPATIVTPGVNYTGNDGVGGGDTVTDNIGNEYTIDVDENGGIRKLTPIGELKFPQILGEVEFEINSLTGFGAILKPRFKRRPIEPQGEVKQVIDCISKDDDLVGYVNGKEYYGPFHIHPTNGRKMVGAKHTSAPHQYIYDTQAESLGSSSGTVSTTTQIIRETLSTSSSTSSSTTTTSTTSSTTTPPPSSTPPPTTSGGGGGTSSTPTPSPTPTPPSPPTPPPSSGGGGYGGGY